MGHTRDALIIAAGAGSRVQGAGPAVKCLLTVGEQPLLRRLLDQFAAAGIERAHVVVGFQAPLLRAALADWPLGLAVEFVENPRWQLRNGISVLAAAEALRAERFLLSMSDHVFDPRIVARATECAVPDGGATLLVDSKVDQVFDLDDATKVRATGERITALGKDLEPFSAIDTGLFCCRPQVFDALREAERSRGDCSLSDGMSLLARAGRLRAEDVGDAWWQDVDTPEMLAEARRRVQVSG